MSFGGLVYYGMKYAQRINTQTSGEAAQTTEKKEVVMEHPCPACCHVDRCRNVNCGAHPLNEVKP